MTVLIADNNISNLAAAKKSIKGKVETFEMDVSKLEDYEKLKAKIESDFDGEFSSIYRFAIPPPVWFYTEFISLMNQQVNYPFSA